MPHLAASGAVVADPVEMHRRFALLALLVVVPLLSGCATAAPASVRQSLTPSTSPTRAPAVSYSTVGELRDAFVEAGARCPHWHQQNRVTNAAESGTCSDANVLATFADESSKAATVSDLKAFASPDLPVVLLVGPNWVINDEHAPGLARVLGGTLVRSEG